MSRRNFRTTAMPRRFLRLEFSARTSIAEWIDDVMFRETKATRKLLSFLQKNSQTLEILNIFQVLE